MKRAEIFTLAGVALLFLLIVAILAGCCPDTDQTRVQHCRDAYKGMLHQAEFLSTKLKDCTDKSGKANAEIQDLRAQLDRLKARDAQRQHLCPSFEPEEEE
jgi:hypothetical protein